MKKTTISLFAAAGMAATASAQLVITEVMSNSSHPGGAANGDWWELTNTGGSSVDLTDFYWDDGDGFGVDGSVFPNVSISAGQSIIIVDENSANVSTFVTDWGGGFTAISKDDFGGANDFSGLSASGDQVDLYDSFGTLVDSVAFGNSTNGFSFEWDTSGNSLGLSVDGVNGAFVATGDGDGGVGTDVGSPGFAAVPEPGAFAAIAGMLALGCVVARRRRNA